MNTPVRKRYVLERTDGSGFRIQHLVEDTDFRPPLWVEWGYLNGGREFKSRDEARDFMVSEVER